MAMKAGPRRLRGIQLLPESALTDTGPPVPGAAKTYFAWPRALWAIARLRDMLSESDIDPDERRIRRMETVGSGTIENVYRIPETFLPMITGDPDNDRWIILFESGGGENDRPTRYDPKARRTELRKGAGTVELTEKQPWAKRK